MIDEKQLKETLKILRFLNGINTKKILIALRKNKNGLSQIEVQQETEILWPVLNPIFKRLLKLDLIEPAGKADRGRIRYKIVESNLFKLQANIYNIYVIQQKEKVSFCN